MESHEHDKKCCRNNPIPNRIKFKAYACGFLYCALAFVILLWIKIAASIKDYNTNAATPFKLDSNFTNSIKDWAVYPYVDIGFSKNNCLNYNSPWEPLFEIEWTGTAKEKSIYQNQFYVKSVNTGSSFSNDTNSTN